MSGGFAPISVAARPSAGAVPSISLAYLLEVEPDRLVFTGDVLTATHALNLAQPARITIVEREDANAPARLLRVGESYRLRSP